MLNLSTDHTPLKINGKQVVIVSISGGETSGYMSAKLKQNYGHLYHFIFIFSNTGMENEETLIFVDQCDREFDLQVVWVEAVVNPEHMKGITHRVTNFNDAYRNHQYADHKHPFHAHIRKSGIPNANKPQCSDRLKAFAIEHYKKVNGLKGAPHAIGIRNDEKNRAIKPALAKLIKLCGTDPDEWRQVGSHKERLGILNNAIELSDKQKKSIETYSSKLRTYGLIYPLIDMFPTTKFDVKSFWSKQKFQLMLEDHEGNCQTCWKKSDKKIALLAIESPERFAGFDYWEENYQHIKPNDDGQPRYFFRKHRSTKMIIKEAALFNASSLRNSMGIEGDEVDAGGCSESCESYSI